MTDIDCFLSSQGRSSSISSFFASPSDDQWYSVRGSWTLQIFRDEAFCDGCFARQFVCSFPLTPAFPEYYIHKVFEGGCRISYFTFVASSLNLWGCMMAGMVWLSPTEAIQPAESLVWLLPHPSGWRLSPYRLHRLHGWWSHLTQWSSTTASSTSSSSTATTRPIRLSTISTATTKPVQIPTTRPAFLEGVAHWTSHYFMINSETTTLPTFYLMSKVQNPQPIYLIWEFLCFVLSDITLFQVILGLLCISIRSVL